MNHSITYADGTRQTLEDNGDGTGTFTTYDAAGDLVETHQVDELPVSAPEPAEQQLVEQLSVLAAEHGAGKVAAAVLLGVGVTDRLDDLTQALADIPDGPVADAVAVVHDAAADATQPS